MSKPGAAERDYVRHLHERMAGGEIRSVIDEAFATELHHPLGNATWETGKGLKAHHWFVVSVTDTQHRQYHLLGEGDVGAEVRISPSPFNRVLGVDRICAGRVHVRRHGAEAGGVAKTSFEPINGHIIPLLVALAGCGWVFVSY